MRILGARNLITASEKQFTIGKAILPFFFLIEFYLKRTEEIKYND